MKKRICQKILILMLACTGIFTAFKCYAAVLHKKEWMKVTVEDQYGMSIANLEIVVVKEGGGNSSGYFYEIDGKDCLFQFYEAGNFMIYFHATGYSDAELRVEVLNMEVEGVTIVAPIYLNRIEE